MRKVIAHILAGLSFYIIAIAYLTSPSPGNFVLAVGVHSGLTTGLLWWASHPQGS